MCERFSLKSREWEELEPMNYPRINPSACLQGTFLYVFGGRDHIDFLDQIERLNIELNVWSPLRV